MSRRPRMFTQADVACILRAAKAANVAVKIQIEPGKLTVSTNGKEAAPCTAEDQHNPWDDLS